VRYAWAANPEGANLVNSEGLPASVFRTDDWTDVEVKEVVIDTKPQGERRALAAEIKALNARRAALDRNSDEYKELAKKSQELMSKFKEGAVAKP
jgi:sialate O-acetylesterase